MAAEYLGHGTVVCDCLKKGIDYAVVVTIDRPETGGLSGSTLEETVSWGKMKGDADHVMVIGDGTVVFPLMVASVIERLGEGFERRRCLIMPKLGEEIGMSSNTIVKILR